MRVFKFIQTGVVTLSLALALASSLALPALAQGEADKAPIPGINSLGTALGGAGRVTSDNPLGSDPVKESDIFVRAKDNGDLTFMLTMWTLTRKLTNIMVVVFLFIAAAATTLNFQVSTYGIKKTLPSVLLATIYANFSYAIAQLLNDVDMAFLRAFVGQPNGGRGVDVMGVMANFIKGPLDGWWARITPDAGWQTYLSALIALAFMAVLALALLFLVVLYILRNYFLAMLIAVAPLAFMSLAMPFTQSVFKKWWDQFIRWMFFPAIAGFWLYLGGVALTAGGVAGGLIGFVMSALILWMAIRTPFTIGAGVAAVAGFLTGNAVSRAVVKSAKNQGIIALNKAPIIGATTRGIRDWNKFQEARVKEAQSGGIMRRRTAPQLVQTGNALKDVFHRVNYLRKVTGHIGTLGFAHDFVAKKINRMAGKAIGRKEEAAAIADQEAALDVEAGKAAQMNDPTFQARMGELSAAKGIIEETMSAISTEAENAALAQKKLFRVTLAEEKELARQRKLLAENVKNTLINDVAAEASNRDNNMHKRIEKRLGKQITKTGYSGLADAMSQTSNNARVSADTLQTVLDEQNLIGADRNVANHKLLMGIADGTIDPNTLEPGQIAELNRFIRRELGNSGIEVSALGGNAGMVQNAHRYLGKEDNIAGSGFRANSAQAQAMLTAGRKRDSFFKKYQGFQGEMSGKRQEVQMKYFQPDDWLREVQKQNGNAVNAFLQNETSLGQFVDSSGNVIRGDTQQSREQHDKIVRDLHDRFNAALRTIKTVDYTDEAFESSVRALANMFQYAGMPFEAALLGDIDQQFLYIQDPSRNDQEKRTAQNQIRRIINNETGLITNQTGTARNLPTIIASLGVSNKYGVVGN